MRLHLGIILLALSAPLKAQSESALRSYFEGRTVRLLIDMPGTQQGVDVYPGTPQPVDFPAHASRLKTYGTAIRRGDEMQITKLKVKRDLIEFQLGGGGFGTFGDDDSPSVSYPRAPKTTREKNLEAELERTTDATAKRRIKEELDDLRHEREREDTRNRASAAQAEEVRVANIRQRRLEGGSRFNLRFTESVPSQALDPQWVVQALDDYVEFGRLAEAASGIGSLSESDHWGPLRKGLTVESVDAMLGRPATLSQRKEGTLLVSVATYHAPTQDIVAEFVEGVLIRFSTTSR